MSEILRYKIEVDYFYKPHVSINYLIKRILKTVYQLVIGNRGLWRPEPDPANRNGKEPAQIGLPSIRQSHGKITWAWLKQCYMPYKCRRHGIHYPARVSPTVRRISFLLMGYWANALPSAPSKNICL